ncbi:transcription factor LRL2-like isoform X1 [Lycium ferocissimum]|uniref:transcription factor LRL2-like isoform X1 n=1 Tax=Lycium ferocissimum TaxID=112874 RepID=UPI002814F5E7|nr:transcription factor LRL2-like isoform X1 [Lycium ferocissimum]XP_059299814.1 transcription factor LRL2-like isoform X1 [Lycium ferocissimum]
MGEENQPNALAQWAFLGSTSDSCYLQGHELNNQYTAGVGIDGIHYVPVPSPQWIHDKQTPQNYVEYLAENVVSEVQVDASAEASGFRLVDGSADMISQEQIRYSRPYYEGLPLNCSIGSKHQTRKPRGDVRHASGPCSEASAAGSSNPSKSSRNSRAALSDKRRRMRIAERIDALGGLFSCSKQVGTASLMEEIIDNVKYLQFQMKDLSRSRLGGEPTSIPFVFLEGCGHYILDDQQIEPLEETMGKLLEVNPSMATQLLESKGLFVMPMALAEGLHHHE